MIKYMISEYSYNILNATIFVYRRRITKQAYKFIYCGCNKYPTQTKNFI